MYRYTERLCLKLSFVATAGRPSRHCVVYVEHHGRGRLYWRRSAVSVGPRRLHCWSNLLPPCLTTAQRTRRIHYRSGSISPLNFNCFILLARNVFVEWIVALLPWCPSVCLSGTGVHCDHTVHFSADLSLWLCRDLQFGCLVNNCGMSRYLSGEQGEITGLLMQYWKLSLHSVLCTHIMSSSYRSIRFVFVSLGSLHCA